MFTYATIFAPSYTNYYGRLKLGKKQNMNEKNLHKMA